MSFIATFEDHIDIHGEDEDSYLFLPGGVLALHLVNTAPIRRHHGDSGNGAGLPEVWLEGDRDA